MACTLPLPYGLGNFRALLIFLLPFNAVYDIPLKI